ncbi:hypothetical protein M404DRAFT_859480 [Pisolithus tinctorius Marx 270]|uniref:Uncharacterized protein n=1 Tax=Pisolithus tinctorius Marx 270 TaxID=870435 RepID=A0A0C3JKT2_PISTI|nr:hypothetical protein M404DRAFT_859480 [Pisolithus tinctorius Marx 270]
MGLFVSDTVAKQIPPLFLVFGPLLYKHNIAAGHPNPVGGPSYSNDRNEKPVCIPSGPRRILPLERCQLPLGYVRKRMNKFWNSDEPALTGLHGMIALRNASSCVFMPSVMPVTSEKVEDGLREMVFMDIIIVSSGIFWPESKRRGCVMIHGPRTQDGFVHSQYLALCPRH